MSRNPLRRVLVVALSVAGVTIVVVGVGATVLVVRGADLLPVESATVEEPSVGICAVVALDYQRGLALSTGRLAAPGAPPEQARGLLRYAIGPRLVEQAPVENEADARAVVEGATDAQDGQITDDDLSRYSLSFDRLKAHVEDRCA